MQYFSSAIIFPDKSSQIKDGIVAIDDDGVIREIIDPLKTEIGSIEIKTFKGIICPAFINTHCHLELSHLKGKLSQRKTLPGFIEEIVSKRNADKEIIDDSIAKADDEMYRNGIAAVGDISNTIDTLEAKRKSKIYYHTFVELFDIFPDRARTAYEDGLKLRDKFLAAGLEASVVPHAPYSVTNELLQLICDEAEKRNDMICIHNQETSSENEMFMTGNGALISKMNQLTNGYNEWKSTGKSSLQSTLPYLTKARVIQFVHNTFTEPEDLRSIKYKVQSTKERLIASNTERIATMHHKESIHTHEHDFYFALCPNANLYIEGVLPDIEMLRHEKCTIGTDSYASNHFLSVLDELKVIQKNFPAITLEELLQWSTINGAKFLGIDDKFGSIEAGKSPGIIHISDINFDSMTLTDASKVSRVV